MSMMGMAFRNQLRTLYGLVQWEAVNRFSRRSLGVFEELAGILIHVLGFSALRLFTGAKAHYGMPVIAFMTSGVFLYWIFKTTIVPVSSFHVGKSRYPMLPRVTQLDVLLARATVNGIMYILVTMATFYFLVLFGLSAPPQQPLMVVMILFMSWIWGVGVGLVCGAVFTYVEILRTLMSGILRVAMYTSGLFFVWPEVPFKLRWIVLYNPMFHLAELMRQAYFASYRSPVADWHFVVATICITCALGLALERVVRPRYGRTQRGQTRQDEEYAADPL